MRTEITRSYKWGFLLPEQELRRIIQAATEHGSKAIDGGEFRLSVQTVLRDGSIIESSSADEVFTLENNGSRRITGVHVTVAPKVESDDWVIHVGFEDGSVNEKSWESASLHIVGASRDWAFVTASDLEERMRRVRLVSFDAIFGSRSSIIIVPVLFVGSMLLSTNFVQHNSHLLLQKQYESGQLHNPIEALIALEKIKNAQELWTFPLMMGFITIVPIAIFVCLAKLLPLIRPSYNFYWSDYCAQYDRRRQIRRSVWTVVILGFVVSVAAAMFSKKIGF